MSEKIMVTYTVTSPHLSEPAHVLHEQMVVEVGPQHLPTDTNETERVNTNIGDNDRRSHSHDRAISEDFHCHFPGGQASLHQNVQRDGHRSNWEHAAFYGDEHQPQNPFPQSQIEFVDDDDDNNQPIDYSMSYHHHMPGNLSFARNNSTDHPTDTTTFISPAATLRPGFIGSGFLPYPARSFIDNRQRAPRSDPYYPAAQHAFARPSVSQYSRGSVADLAASTNGVAAHPSGAVIESVDASSQTEIERTVSHSCEDNCHRMFMESNNFILKVFIQCFNTISLIASGGILNCASSNFEVSSSQIHSLNVPSSSENRSDVRLENVCSHEANAEETQVANIPNGKQMKNVKKKTKGIPQKRSQRILDMAARKEKESHQNADEAEVVPPKKAKSNSDGEFKVESVSNCPVSND